MRETNKRVSCWSVGAVFVLGCSAQDGAGQDGEMPAPMDQAPVPMDEAPSPMSCTAEFDCAMGLACMAGTCRPCSAHGQCQSDVCDQDAITVLGPGACVSEARVVYVDDGAWPACETGDGSRASPVCEIRDAIPLVAPGKDAVRVYPGMYLPFGVSGRTVHVFGSGGGAAVVGKEDLSAAAHISGGARVVLDGLEFDVAVRDGVICKDSDLKVVRSSARGDYGGIVATDCVLVVDRVRASSLLGSGLAIAGTGTYSITNSYFSGGDSQAVVFSGSSTGTFRFNTVGGGGEIRPGGIDCGTSSREIQDSIVVGSFPAAGGAQTVGACLHQRVVVGSGDTRADLGLRKIDPELDPQGRLLDTAANAACCIDKGALVVPGLGRDFFGTLRPQGPSNDIGAHELPHP